MAQLSDDCFAFGGPMMSVDEAVGLITTRVNAIADIETVALVEADVAGVGKPLDIVIRGRPVKAEQVKLPFYRRARN